jgi:hypothetical protein
MRRRLGVVSLKEQQYAQVTLPVYILRIECYQGFQLRDGEFRPVFIEILLGEPGV